ncbi:uncharacterized protein LOC117171004 [Belonocnema kinseyi]|uniref:uncharacterized protein LOC117171004 n=1 Tax=Belonocnema kinseyi TaxID=2817044 RepID=UPI00143DC4FC|nr:uncharacterized protein LOC117171004 [Belonocnema kinseyi]
MTTDILAMQCMLESSKHTLNLSPSYQLQRFSEIENLPIIERQAPDDQQCENVFSRHRRDTDVRYKLRPSTRFDIVNALDSSLPGAFAALIELHQRIRREPKITKAYIEFVNEYLRLGHMREINHQEVRSCSGPVDYIPHYGIWLRGDQESKLRGVFNASRPTSTGYSLNDDLFTGSTLQTHPWRVIIRRRQYRFVFCTDVKKMYRIIRIDDRDVDLQRIVWSPPEEETVRHFQLLTITYGESCAPYLSLRVIQQLCFDEGKDYPETVDTLMKDRYVDDILSEAYSIESDLHLRDQRRYLLTAGGFQSRKWITKNQHLLQTAVVYVRVLSKDDHVCTVLLAAKTKLNSIKSLQPSIRAEPRMMILPLELQAALLASKLLCTIANDLCIPSGNCYALCDAQIVLHWLDSSIPVGNSLTDDYISYIQEIIT